MGFLDRVDRGVKRAREAKESPGDLLAGLRQQCAQQVAALEIIGPWLDREVPASAGERVVFLSGRHAPKTGPVLPHQGNLVYTYGNEEGGGWTVVPPREGVDSATRLLQFLVSIPRDQVAKELGDTIGSLVDEHNIPREALEPLAKVPLG